MHLSNLIKQLTNPAAINDMYTYMQCISALYQNYGKNITIQTHVANTNPELGDLLQLLIDTGHYTKKSISKIHKAVTDAHNHTNNITHIQTSNEQAANQSSKQRDNVQTHDTAHIGLTIKTDDKIYRRQLTTDLEKMLT